MRCFSLLAGALFASCLLGVHSAVLRAQPVTPAAPIPLLTGTLTSTGSDTPPPRWRPARRSWAP